MDNTSQDWRARFELTVCPASLIEQTIPPAALGVAVIYEEAEPAAKILLVVESRAGSLRSQCLRRLQSGKLPAAETLKVAFKAETLAEPSPEAVQAACRTQVILAGELRRELRPAMR